MVVRTIVGPSVPPVFAPPTGPQINFVGLRVVKIVHNRAHLVTLVQSLIIIYAQARYNGKQVGKC